MPVVKVQEGQLAKKIHLTDLVTLANEKNAAWCSAADNTQYSTYNTTYHIHNSGDNAGYQGTYYSNNDGGYNSSKKSGYLSPNYSGNYTSHCGKQN